MRLVRCCWEGSWPHQGYVDVDFDADTATLIQLFVLIIPTCPASLLQVFLSSFTSKLSVFIALYAVLFGAGAGRMPYDCHIILLTFHLTIPKCNRNLSIPLGVAYTAPMAAGWKWLPDKKGLVSGVSNLSFASFFLLMIPQYYSISLTIIV